MFESIQLKVFTKTTYTKFNLTPIQQLAVERILGLGLKNYQLVAYTDDDIEIPPFDTQENLKLIKF